MKVIALTSSLVFFWHFTAAAQGHLSAGDTLSVGFNAVDGCQFLEATVVGGYVRVSFGGDLLEPGESLKLEMFENSLSEPPVAVQTYTAVTLLSDVRLTSPGSWLDDQGLVRVSMLNGSVEIPEVFFGVSPNNNTFCHVEVAVPEPTTTILVSFGGLLGALFWCYRRTKKPRGPT